MELYVFITIILIASMLQGITGFGNALIAAPLALLFIDKTTSVIALTFVSIALNGTLFITIREVINKLLFLRLFLASLVGLPLGVIILQQIDINYLRIFVGSLSVLFVMVLYSKKVKINFSKFNVGATGIVSGILHSSLSMSGPPVVLLLAGQNTAKDETRKTLAAFFLIMSVVTLGLFLITENLTHSGIIYGLYSIPTAILGGHIGHRIAKRVSQKQFITLAFILVSIAGTMALYSGLNNL